VEVEAAQLPLALQPLDLRDAVTLQPQALEPCVLLQTLYTVDTCRGTSRCDYM